MAIDKNKFSYGIIDFLKEKMWILPEWVWLLFFFFFERNSIIASIISTVPIFFLVRWKRQKFFEKGEKGWKEIGGILFGANIALLVIYYILNFIISVLFKV